MDLNCKGTEKLDLPELDIALLIRVAEKAKTIDFGTLGEEDLHD